MALDAVTIPTHKDEEALGPETLSEVGFKENGLVWQRKYQNESTSQPTLKGSCN